MRAVIESIEHDAFSRCMNPPQDGWDGVADVKTFSGGERWCVCPYCGKKAVKVLIDTKAYKVPHKCRNNKCGKEFIINL